ncbi:WD40 repeat domain-containing serine/threonine protein kinase [Actinomadura opuntiae]|uniref:WD40 repeat domain-containing serine/threonine protein kinase n=1 Tax=Actinomadura sp. OS1-43 TaxID=604315 RepID=UPI00255AFD7C|nr:WD40 repeat domain-containing serine/threonine protein kinase [Actinomadura sp. OS1-43]MDL4815271.1 WD40 repeat domain-containing serine/threonine protein kinase [Actinomadura sp. OS1-43]
MPAPLLDGDPRQLGGYWLAGRLGAGGQGVVYEGYDAKGRRVAVKALHAETVSEALRNGLRKEVATLQRVASFCTARILGADLDNAPPYVVSEYVPGPDLAGWVGERGAYGPDELHRLAIGIATALASIHRAGIIHRDLKPANVLLGPDGPRVIDFGIAKTDEMSRSATGALKGTPRWMAPELFRGKRATPAVDVWAWAAVVLFAANGRPPFDGETMAGLHHQILNERPKTDVLAEPLRGLVEAALSQEPEQRPSAQEVLDGLLSGVSGDALEAGTRAAGAGERPSVTLPPALGDVAEHVYGRLDREAQQAVPRVLLRMVAAPADAQGALRPVPVSDLVDGVTSERALQEVLDGFCGAGLVRRDGAMISIATPALLRAWPRLADWVSAERDGLAAHQSLAGAARLWNANGRKQADLYQGSALDGALAWASVGRRQLTLNLAERAFLDASVRQTRDRARTRAAVTVTLAVLLVLALGAGAAVAVQSRSLRKTNATVAQQRDAAVGRQLATQAVQLRRTDPVLARRLAVAASDLAGNTFETRDALLTLTEQWEGGMYRPAGAGTDWNTLSPDKSGPYAWVKDNTIILGNPDTKKALTLRVAGAPVAGMGITLDGKRLLTLQKDGTLALWDTASGARTGLPFKHAMGDGLWFSPTGARLVTTHSGTVKILDTATGRVLFTAKEEFSITGPAFSPDERSLVGVAKDGGHWRLVGRDLTTFKRIKIPDPVKELTQTSRIAYSPDGRLFAATAPGGAKDQIAVVDTKTGELRTSLIRPKDNDDYENEIVFSPDGRFLASGMALWSTDVGTNEPPYLFYKPDDMCTDTRFSADGRKLRCMDTEERVQSIDVTVFVRPVQVSRPYGESAISGDGSTLATVDPSPSNGVQIWDTAKATRRTILPITYSNNYGGDRMALSHDGKLLVLLRQTRTVEIWDVRTRTKRTTFDLGPVASPVSRPLPSFSPDGKAIATVTLGGPATPANQNQPQTTLLQFWDTATGRQLGQARAANRTGASDGTPDLKIVWSADGKSVVSANDLGVIAFPSGKTLAPPNPLATTVQAVSRQGTLVTVQDRSDRRSLSFWNARTLKQIGSPVATPDGKSPIAAISPDGALLATTDMKGKIDLWDVHGQRRLGLPLTGHTTSSIDAVIESLAFSPDGTRLYSVSGEDGKLVAHVVAPRLLEAGLCKRVGALTRHEWSQYVREVPYRKTC